MKTHHLIVTLSDLTPEEQEDYDAESPEGQRDIDIDRMVINVECPGPDPACTAWMECLKDHPDITPEIEDEGEGVLHGVFHQKFYLGWAVDEGKCGLLIAPDAWIDSATDLARRLGPGRHPIEFEWDDEFTIVIHDLTGVER